MPGERNDVADRLAELSDRLVRVERRLEALEIGSRAPQVPDEPVPSPEPEPAGTTTGEYLPLLGRTLLILAGAFLFRAVTEMGLLPQAIGTALGMAYAILLIVLADRASGKERRTSGTFYGLAAAIIGYPLLWEATVKFQFLSAPACAAGLAALTALALTLAYRRGLRRLAWVFTIAATITSLGLAVPTRTPVLFTAFLLALGIAALWIGYARGWRSLGWTVAVFVDLSAVLLGAMFAIGKTDQVVQVVHPASLLALQLAMTLLYLGSFAWRALRLEQPLGPGEMLQGCAVMVTGLGGSIMVIRATSISGTGPGTVGILLAILCYSASFAFIGRRPEEKRNFVFFTTLALVSTLVSLGVLLEGAMVAVMYSIAALLAGWIGDRRRRATLGLHAAVYVLAAATTSGLLSASASSMLGATVNSAEWITVPVLIVLGVVFACSWFRVPEHGKTWGGFSKLSELTTLVVLAAGLGGLAVTLCAPLVPSAPDGVADRAVLAVLRTGVLSISTILLAWIRRWGRFSAAGWLVYPLLIAGGAKLLLEDVPSGRPATLIGSLLFYGLALIVAPRLVRHRAGIDEPG